MILACILLVTASVQYLVFCGFIAVTFFIVPNKRLCVPSGIYTFTQQINITNTD